MSTEFDTACESPLGAFVESLLGVRGCRCPDLVTGGCCINALGTRWRGQCVSGVTVGECASMRGTYTGDNQPCTRNHCWTIPDLPDSDSGMCCYHHTYGYSPDSVDTYVRCSDVFSGGAGECGRRMDDACANEPPFDYPICSTSGGFQPHYRCTGRYWGPNEPQSCGDSQGICCVDGIAAFGGVVSERWCTEIAGGIPIGPLAHPDNCGDLLPCCHPDANGIIQCSIQWPTNCYNLGGRPVAEGGSCEEDTCKAGACNLPCDRCIDNVSEAQCSTLGGSYNQDGSTCPEL